MLDNRLGGIPSECHVFLGGKAFERPFIDVWGLAFEHLGLTWTLVRQQRRIGTHPSDRRSLTSRPPFIETSFSLCPFVVLFWGGSK
jgi:hypothetical protein